jgi:hypothetical protein
MDLGSLFHSCQEHRRDTAGKGGPPSCPLAGLRPASGHPEQFVWHECGEANMPSVKVRKPDLQSESEAVRSRRWVRCEVDRHRQYVRASDQPPRWGPMLGRIHGFAKTEIPAYGRFALSRLGLSQTSPRVHLIVQKLASDFYLSVHLSESQLLLIQS